MYIIDIAKYIIVDENIIGAPKMLNNFWYTVNFYFNILLDPHLVIALLTLQ